MDELERKLIESVIKDLIVRRNYYCVPSYVKILYYLKDRGSGIYVIYNNIDNTWVERDDYNRKTSSFYYKKEYLSWNSIMNYIDFDSLLYKKQLYHISFLKKKRFEKLFILNVIENF